MIHTTYDNDEPSSHEESPDNGGQTTTTSRPEAGPVGPGTATTDGRHPEGRTWGVSDPRAAACVVVPVPGKD
jgi:hypothetical protein